MISSFTASLQLPGVTSQVTVSPPPSLPPPVQPVQDGPILCHFPTKTRGLPRQDLKLLPRLPHNPHHAGSNWCFVVIVCFICNPPPGDKNKTIRDRFHWLTHAIFPFPTIRYLWYVVFFSTLSQPLRP